MKMTTFGMACVLALVACSKPKPAGDSTQTPAQAPAASPASAAADKTTVSVKVRDLTIQYSHFSVDWTGGITLQMQGIKGVVANIGSQSLASDGSSETGGLSVFFSGDASCRYAEGAVFQLTDPCIIVSAGNTQSSELEGIAGMVNTCQFKGEAPFLAMSCVNIKSFVTKGTLTLRRWSPSGPIEFSFSPDAQLTGAALKIVPGVSMDYVTFAVPVSGTVSATP